MRMVEAAEAVRRAQARRHDRRADLRQHRRRAGDGRPGQGLQVRLRLPGQGQRGQAQRAQGVRRRGGRLPDRGRAGAPGLLLQRLRPAGARDRGRLEARPVLQPEQPAARTTRPPARRSGSRPTAGSPTSSRGVGTGGTISGIGRYLKEQNPATVQIIGADPAGLGVLRRHRPAVPGRGRRRGLLARDLRPGHRRPDHRGLRRGLVRDDPPAGPRGGAAGRRLLRHGGVRRGPARARARRTPTSASSSCCCRTAAAAT